MKRFETEIRFLTPAFLGDAFQKGRWRTPPFKALLREWWRIAAAKQHDYDWKSLREAEGLLFGHAFLERGGRTWASRSRVLIRLAPWAKGGLGAWNEQPETVRHPEVQFNNGQIDPFLYLGYGPLTYQNGVRLVRPPAIKAGETAGLVIHSTDEKVPAVARLIHAFGTVGSRCRNGWGSIALACHEAMTADEIRGLAEAYARPLKECLQLDWPHAFAKDRRGVCLWQIGPFGSWNDAMKKLAEIRIGVRTSVPLASGHGPVQERHVLGYPTTNHLVGDPEPTDDRGRRIGLFGEVRIPNCMHFKVVSVKDGLRAVIYITPHRIPTAVWRHRKSWRTNGKKVERSFYEFDVDDIKEVKKQFCIWTHAISHLDDLDGVERL